MILDTSFVLDLLEGDEGAVEKATELERDDVPMKLPAMTLLQLYIGVGAAVAPDEERRIRRVIDPLPVIPMDETISMRARRTIGEVDTSRFKRWKGDAVIGATADVEGEPVLTRNVGDFENLGFAVETY